MRERVLKVLMVLVGLLFLAGLYPIVIYLWRPGNEPPGDAMMLSLYVTLESFCYWGRAIHRRIAASSHTRDGRMSLMLR
jgi:hypothetical protein